jgi:hypothetical protein
MAFKVLMFTDAFPFGFYLKPEGKHAKHYVYPDRIAASGAVVDAKAGMQAAGVDTSMVTYLIEEAAE